MSDSEKENPSVTRFREYLRINTIQPSPNYYPCLDYLKQQAAEIGLDFRIIETGIEGKPLGLMTWKGSKPDLKSILLSSHMDVVPVFPEEWKYEPFSAHKDENGDIFARGAQDMKCVTIWYLEAIRRLKSEGKSFARTIHLLFSADEEIGSDCTKRFVESQGFQDLNASFGLDEGIANPGNKIRVFYGERSVWWFKITCQGNPGHASAFIENTAVKKLQNVLNSCLAFREEQESLFKANPEAGLGAVTSLNVTILEGGVQANVVPATMSATVDMRVTPTATEADMKAMIRKWCNDAGPDVDFEMLVEGWSKEMVSLSDDNPWWVAFRDACKSENLELQTEIFPAATDSRLYRRAGVDMIGFSPMNNTPILLHDHNEYLNEKVFLRGIDIYCKIIPALADLQQNGVA
ncbi:aminoacylase [Elysia marginata]|uniref:N-acyl-aliphatic-L-amino acid amidohydrolase n=1 Tax=Elysia marginata TaxID=1093978 RepID=A0AAV4HYW5_9GAST|nr:aminoacylase [Elysia marginata]